MVCRHNANDVKPSALSRVLGQLRLHRGSNDDCAVSSCATERASVDHGPLESMRNYALEAEMAKARAFVQWENARRSMM